MENQTKHTIFLPGDKAQQQEKSGAPGCAPGIRMENANHSTLRSSLNIQRLHLQYPHYMKFNTQLKSEIGLLVKK